MTIIFGYCDLLRFRDLEKASAPKTARWLFY